MLAESVLELLTDPAHWIQEAVAEPIFFTIEVFILDKLLHHHTSESRHVRRRK